MIDLILNLVSKEVPAYPVLRRELCIFIVVTELRGKGEFFLKIVHADMEQDIFASKTRTHDFGSDPLKAHGIPFRIRNCLFPSPGLYWIQFWFDGALIHQQELFAR
ncbi:MAG: hypothetical protein FJ271_22190 [Planctomycetes bacterium]|nr:hypothetical protein [Planctomycetota bacterium]